jgi:hypothetical protein
MMTHQIPVLVTAFTGEPRAELKRHMAKNLVKSLKQQGMFVCFASHSTHDEETQSYCDVFIYDKDNSFPAVSGGHGLAELRSIYNAMAILKQKGFKSFIKTSFDMDPTIDFKLIADKSIASGKEVVTTTWGGNIATLSTMFFYSTIDFIEKTLTMEDTQNRVGTLLECVWCDSVNSKGLRDRMLITHPHSEGIFGYDLKNYSEGGGVVFGPQYIW